MSETLHIADESFTVQHLQSEMPELNDALVKEFCEQFQMVFANQPYGQFLFYPSEGRTISAQEVFQTSEAVDLDKIKSFDPNNYPVHLETKENTVLWVDPERTFEVFSKKVRKNAFLSILRNEEDEAFVGAVLGYECSLEEAFEQEEWQDDKLYSSLRMPEKYRDRSQYLKKIQEEARDCFPDAESISLETRVFCFNCIFLVPSYQGRGIGYHFLKAFMDQLPQTTLEMPSIAELVIETTLLKRATSNPNTKLITGVLSTSEKRHPGDRVLVISKAAHFQKQVEELLQSE